MATITTASLREFHQSRNSTCGIAPDTQPESVEFSRLAVEPPHHDDRRHLLPPEADLAGILQQLFVFDRVIYHDGQQDADIPVDSSTEAVRIYSSRMGTDHIRFPRSNVENTEGG